MPNSSPTVRSKRLERLFPQAIGALFSGAKDPLAALPIGQLKVLRVLEERPATPSQLAVALSLTPSAVSQLAARLKASGLIEQSVDTHDRRVKHLALSSVGREVMRKRSANRARQAAKVLRNVPCDVQEELVRSLELLVQSAQKPTKQPL